VGLGKSSGAVLHDKKKPKERKKEGNEEKKKKKRGWSFGKMQGGTQVGAAEVDAGWHPGRIEKRETGETEEVTNSQGIAGCAA